MSMKIRACSLKDLVDVGGLRLSVPLFQRDYVWGKSHCAALWDDIKNSDEHYVGAVVLQKIGEVEGNEYHIIDGQQRLTSLSLMALACARRLESADKERADEIAATFLLNGGDLSPNPNLKLKLWEGHGVSNNFFWQMLVKGDPGNLNPVDEGQEKIKRAFRFFQERFRAMESDEAAYKFMSHQAGGELIFARIETRSTVNAHVIFETLNGRGVALSQAAMIKSFLLASAGQNENVFKRYVALWNKLRETVSQYDSEMGHFIRTVYNAENSPSARGDELHGKVVRLIDGGITAGAYLDKLKDRSVFYRSLRRPGDTHSSSGEWPRVADWWRARFFRDIGLRQVYSLLMSASMKFDRENFSRAMRLCEVIAFRRMTIGGLDARPLADACNDAAYGIFHGNIADARALRGELQHRCPSDSRFKADFAEREFSRSTQDNTRRVLRYILAELEAKERQFNPLPDSGEFDRYGIGPKMVVPLRNSEGWRRDDEVSQLSNRIGNFVLWEDVQENENPPDADERRRSIYVLTRETGERWPDFTRADLEQRQKRLAELAVKTWSLEEDGF